MLLCFIGRICIRFVYWYFPFNMEIVVVLSEMNALLFAAVFHSCSQLSWKRACGLLNNQHRNSSNVSPSQIYPCKYSSLKIHPIQGIVLHRQDFLYNKRFSLSTTGTSVNCVVTLRS